MYFELGGSYKESKAKRIKKLKKRLDAIEEVLESLLKHLELNMTNTYPFDDYGSWEVAEKAKKEKDSNA